MAIARTAHGATKTSSTASTTTGAITVTVASGETIVVAVGTVGTTSNAPTDNATGGSNTYVQLGSTATNTERITFWGCLSSKSAVTAITCTFTSSRYGVAIDTYTGVVGFNQSNTTTHTGSASPATATLPSSLGSGNWSLAGFVNKGTATWSASTGNLRANVAGAGTTTPGACIVDNTTTTSAAAESGSNVWAGTIIELQSFLDVTVSPTGSALTSSTGNPTISGNASVSPTGSALSSAVGTVTATPSIEVFPTGNSLTASTGAASITGGGLVALFGNVLTSAVSSVSIKTDVAPTISGNALAASVGTVSVTTSGGSVDVNVFPTGSESDFAIGSVSVTGDASVSLSGSPLTIAASGVAISGDSQLSLAGSAASVSSGTVSVSTETPVSVDVLVSGNSTIASFGAVEISALNDVLKLQPTTKLIDIISKTTFSVEQRLGLAYYLATLYRGEKPQPILSTLYRAEVDKLIELSVNFDKNNRDYFKKAGLL